MHIFEYQKSKELMLKAMRRSVVNQHASLKMRNRRQCGQAESIKKGLSLISILSCDAVMWEMERITAALRRRYGASVSATDVSKIWCLFVYRWRWKPVMGDMQECNHGWSYATITVCWWRQSYQDSKKCNLIYKLVNYPWQLIFDSNESARWHHMFSWVATCKLQSSFYRLGNAVAISRQ
jgi:hypothetical protein